MREYDVVIIGAGLGGLECASILGRHGLKVAVLEKHFQLGGCLQSFRRSGALFDAGFHYVGGLDEGRPLHRLFKYFDLLDLPWVKLDSDCSDEIVLNGKSYPLAGDHQLFVDQLSKLFPTQTDNLKKYNEALSYVGEHIFDALRPESAAGFFQNEAFSSSAWEFLERTIADPVLRNVLSGSSLKLELKKETLPFYVFAQINNSFIEGSYRLQGGGETLVNRLVKNVEAMGVEVFTKSEVSRLEVAEGRIIAAHTTDGGVFAADHFISNIHPAASISLLGEDSGVRKAYRNRIMRLENTYGMFTVNIKLKPNTLPYLNKNIFIYTTDDVWQANKTAFETNTPVIDSLMVSFPPSQSSFADVVDLLTPMPFSLVEKWSGTNVGRRDAEYEKIKEEWSEACICMAEKQMPGLRLAIDRVYTSTPLTYLNYTGTSQGTAYGIRKDFNNTMLTFLPPKTPVANYYLTGQNLNLHGILGTSMSSFITCSAILGFEKATEGLL